MVAAYVVRIRTKTHGSEDWREQDFSVAHDCDQYIRKKRPPPPPAPGPVPEDPRVASERSEAHDLRDHELIKVTARLVSECKRKEESAEEKRRKAGEVERHRRSSEHAAQAAARAAAREKAPPPADLRAEESDAVARAKRETKKAEDLTRIAENRARQCEEDVERMKEALKRMKLLRTGDLIQRGNGE
jgi:hypothetical protein